jgi:hypothetical membrane protein
MAHVRTDGRHPGVTARAASSRTIGLLGLSSVAIILAGSLIAGLAYQGWAGEPYSPLNHFFSELGEVAISRLALVFNLGIIAGGLGMGTFVLLLSSRLSGRFRGAIIVVGVVAGVSGSLVGVFPMDSRELHRVVSDTFFVTAWLVGAIFSAWLLAAPRPGFSRWLLVPGALVIVGFVAFIVVYSTFNPADSNAHSTASRPDVWSVPLLEWAALLSMFVWFACVSVALLLQKPEPAAG